MPDPVPDLSTSSRLCASALIAHHVRYSLLLAAALVAACAIFYGPFLTGSIPIGADNSLMYLPFFSLRWDGGPPLWNPYALGGAPLVDNLQAAMLYPLRWPFYFVDWRAWFGPFNFLNYLAAFAGMALLLRRMGLGAIATIAGSVLFAAGGHMTGRVINPTIFYASCWLPWLLAGAVPPLAPENNQRYQGYGRPGRSGGWLSAFGFFMLASAGSPHLILYGLLGYAAVYFSFLRPGDGPRRLLTDAAGRLGYLFLGFALAAPVLIPGFLRAGRSIRTLTSVEANLTWSLAWSEIPYALLGGLGGVEAIAPEFIDKTLYVGPVALALVLFWLLRPSAWRDRRTYAGLLLALLGFWLALGSNAGWQFIMPWVPGLRLLEGPARALVLSAAGLSILAALAIDRWPVRLARPFGLALLAAGVGVVIMTIRLTWRLPAAEASPPFTADWIGFALAAPATIRRELWPWIDAAWALPAAALILVIFPRRPRAAVLLLILLIGLQLFHFAPRVRPPLDTPDRFAPTPAIAHLMRQAETSPEPFRIAGFDPHMLNRTGFDHRHLLDYLQPNLATLYGLEDIQGFDPLIDRRYLELVRSTAGRLPTDDPIRTLSLATPDETLFRILGVRYLAGHPYDRIVKPGLQSLTPAEPFQPVELPAALAGRALTHWSIVSQAGVPGDTKVGTLIARLVIEADEGTFEFPIRYGIETGRPHDLNLLRLYRVPEFTVEPHAPGIVSMPAPILDNALQFTNWRALISFGRPLTPRSLRWEVLIPGATLHLESQALRLAPPPESPWRLAFGSEDSPAPVFEYLAATPRGGRGARAAGGGAAAAAGRALAARAAAPPPPRRARGAPRGRRGTAKRPPPGSPSPSSPPRPPTPPPSAGSTVAIIRSASRRPATPPRSSCCAKRTPPAGGRR